MVELFSRIKALRHFLYEDNIAGLAGLCIFFALAAGLIAGTASRHPDRTYSVHYDRVVAVKVMDETFYAKTSSSGVFARSNATFEGDRLKLWCKGSSCHQSLPYTGFSGLGCLIGALVGLLIGTAVWLWILLSHYSRKITAHLKQGSEVTA